MTQTTLSFREEIASDLRTGLSRGVNEDLKEVLLKAWCHGQSRCSEITRGERGATAVEYAILVSLIAAILFAVVTAIGSKTSNEFESVNKAPW